MTASKQLVYGIYDLHDSLCLFEADHLARLSAETDAIKACATVEQISALAPTLTTAWSPHDEDEVADTLTDEGPDAAWDWSQTGSAQDGDWPPMPTAYALELFDRSDPVWAALLTVQGVEQVTTTLNGDYLHLPVDQEHRIVQVLREHGYTVTKDQALVDPLCME